MFISAHTFSKILPQHIPFPAKVLRNDGDEPFETSQDGTVNHHRSRRGLVRVRRLVRGAVLEVEPLRELKVELDGRTLERSAQCVLDVNVDLGTVEGTVSWIDSPLPGVLLVEGLFQLLYHAQSARDRLREQAMRLTASAMSQVSIVPR